MSEWLLVQNGIYVYIGIFLMLLGSAFFLPIPEDLPIILGGIMVHRGNADLKMTLLVCYIGILIGDIVLFYVGRYFGSAIFKKKLIQAHMTPRRLSWIKLNLERRSFYMILIARHLFYMRTLTFLTCGAVKMRFSRFIIADSFAALISAPLMLSLGYLLAEHYDALFDFIHKAKIFSLFLAIGLVIFAGWYIRKKLRRTAVPAQPGSTDTTPPV